MVAVRQQVVAQDYWTEAEAIASARQRYAGPRVARASEAQHHRQAILTRAIESQVIPRLLLARRPTVALQSTGALRSTAARQPASPEPSLVVVEKAPLAGVGEFVGLVLARELQVAKSFIDGLLVQGTTTESLYLDLLAPAARQLGDMWEQDLCDFTEVTVALWRLNQVLRELGPAFHHDADLRAAGPRALLMPVPGEQHTFGLAMVVDFFRRDGWAVWSGAVESGAELTSLVRGHAFAVVGFSVACGDRLETVADAIRRVRRASRNRDIGVMVGGPAFVAHPELAQALGADATAVDGLQAVQQARTLLGFVTGRR